MVIKIPILFEEKTQCCGCGACVDICPVCAITLKEDEYGFLYPAVEEEKCIHCNQCTKVCLYKNTANTHSPIEAYAGVTNNTDIFKSASGGVFASVATEFIKNGGVVFGAVSDIKSNDLYVSHKGAKTLDELDKMLGSKYVQSDTSKVFSTVENELKNDSKVLFSGTPCQVAALKNYLHKDYENLFTVDLICHGVPSQKFFNDYLHNNTSENEKIKNFVFRDKSKGIVFTSKLVTETNSKTKIRYIHQGTSSFYYNFLKGSIYRESCYECKFACKDRVGDITIGDFWGAKANQKEIIDSNFDPEKGISCILVNTNNGKRLIEQYANKLHTKETTFNIIAMENEQLKNPSKPSQNRQALLDLYKVNGYTAVEKNFRKSVGNKYYVSKLKSKIPSDIKKKLKSILNS